MPLAQRVHLQARILNLWSCLMKEELTGADYLHSVKIGTLLGFIVGFAIGIALSGMWIQRR
jgi:hypothetical protein